MSDEPDVNEIRRHLKWLIVIIVVVLVGLVSLTLFLYAHLTSGVRVTPN